MLQPKTAVEKKVRILNAREKSFEGFGVNENQNTNDLNGGKKRYVLRRKKEYEGRLRDEVLDGEKKMEWSWA